MADDIGGLSVSFTADAAQLQGELRRMEQQLRAFDRAFGKQQVHLTAALQQPGQRAVADMRRGIQRKIETDGGLRFTPRLQPPQARDLDAFSATLGRRMPAVTVNVKGVWAGWETPPPKAVTMGVSGGAVGGAAPAVAASGVVRAPMATTTPRTGAHVVSDTTVRAREQNRRRARTGATVAPVTKPAAQTAAQRRVTQLAANEARAAAQTKTASRSEVFHDYTDQMLLEDYLDKNTPPGHRNKLASELRSRGFNPPPLTRTGETAGPTGGPRGFTDPYVASKRREQRESMRRANAARLSYAYAGMPRGPRVGPETDEERAARIGAALGRPVEEPGGARGFAASAPALTAAGNLVGGASAARGKGSTAPQDVAGISRTVRPSRGTTMAQHVLQSALPGATLPAEAVSISRLRSMIPQLTAGNRQRGEDWYPQANRELKRMRKAYGLDGRLNDAQLSGIAGVFSANADWPQNLRLVSGFFSRMAQGVNPANAEGFLGLGNFVDPIVKAAQIASMKNPSMAEIASRRDVMTGDQFLQRKPGKGSAFADKTGAFVGALHAGAGPKQEAESRNIWSVLAPMDRWMTRAIHGIEGTGGKGHRQGWRAIDALKKASGFKTDFGFQAGIWDLVGPAQAEAAPFGRGVVPPPLPAAGNPVPSRFDILNTRAVDAEKKASEEATAKNIAAARRKREMAQREAQYVAGMSTAGTRAGSPGQMPQVAAFMSPTPAGLMVSPGSQIDPVSGTPTAAAQESYGYMQDRELTAPERYARRQNQQWNRQQSQQSRMFGRWSSGPGVGVAAFNGGLRNPRGQFASERQVEEEAGVGAPGAPNWTRPQRTATPVGGASPTAQAAIDLKSLSSAARDMVKELEAHPNLESSFRQAVPDLFTEIDTAQQKANAKAAAGAVAGPTADEVAAQRLRRITGGEGSEADRQRTFLEGSRARTREASGVQQTLSLGRTIGSMTAGVLGGNRDRERIASIKRLESEYERVGRAGVDAFEAVGRAEVELDKARIQRAPDEELARLRKTYEEATSAAAPFANAQKQVADEIVKQQGRISRPLAALRGSFSALSGAIIGGVIYSAAIDGLSALAGAFEGPIDRLSGFRMTAERTAPAIGQLVRQYHGLSDVAFEASVAQTGLGRRTADAIKPAIEQRAAVEGGNAAFREQLDLIRGAGYFSRNPNAGISQTTGGFLGSSIGGQQPFFEQLLQSGSPVGGPFEDPRLRGVIGGAMAGAGAGGLLGSIAGPVGAGVGLLAGGAAGAVSGLLSAAFTPEQAQTFAGRYQGGQLTEDEQARLTEFRQALDSTNDAAKRANPQIAATAKAVDLLGDNSVEAQAAVDATQKLLADMGATEGQLEAAEALRFAIVNPRTGQAVPDERAARGFLNTSLRGMTMPDRDAAVEQSAMQIRAQLQLSQWQGQRQRETMIPGQRYLSGLASGRLGVGGGLTGKLGVRDLPKGIALEAPNYEAGTQALSGLQQQMSSTAKTGRTQLLKMLLDADVTMLRATGSTSNLTGKFNLLEGSIAANGTAMRGLQRENTWAQANLQLAQYDEQIRVTNRSLQDAISFQTGVGSGQLGLLQNRARGLEIAGAEVGFQQQSLGLQGQQLGLQSAGLSIRSRELALMQSQRQINFQTALAGFTAPGMTGAERAARQDEAKIEAEIAQQQQNIGVEGLDVDREQVTLQAQQVALAGEGLAIAREQFAVQQAMVSVNAARAVEDLTNQINLLQQARMVTLTVTINNEAIAAYQEQIAADMDGLQSVIQEAYDTQQTVMQNSAQLAATYGERVTDWNNRILAGLSNYLSRASALLSGAMPVSRVGGPASGNRASAAGFFQNVSGPTTFTVGEAGPETVAIVRNPRNLTMQPTSEGAGVTVIVDVHDNQLSGDARDMDAFAAIIARKVEEQMGRKISQLGLGPRR